MSQLRHSSRAEVNKFLLVCVILFKQIDFRQCLVYLRERIFNCFNVKLKLKFTIEKQVEVPRYYLSMDAIFPLVSYRDIISFH